MARPAGYYFFGARGPKLVAAIVICAAVSFLLLGYDQGVLSGVLTNKHFVETMGHPSSSLIALAGTVVAMYDVGAWLGAMSCACFGEKLGRKRSAYLGLVTMLIGAAIQTACFSAAQMLAGRIVTGLGMGTLGATFPMWAAEMVKPASRGRLLSALGSSVGFGIFFSYWFEYGLSYASGAVAWRLPVSLQMGFAAISCSMLILLPESPRWLIAHDRLDEAVAVLAAIESTTADEHTPAVIARRDDIIRALELEHAQGPVRWGELFENNETKNRRRVILAIGIQVFQQMSGVNALVYYIPYLLQTSMGLSEKTSLWVSGLNGLVFFLSSAYPIFFLDKYGRPKPFMVASTVQSISMVMVAILLSINTNATNNASIVFFFTYIAIYGTCYMGTPWLYSPELLPLRLRAKATAVATSFSWLCTFVVVEITPPAITNIGWKTYIIFAVLNASFVPLIYSFYPDTARKSLEEIDEIFMGKKVGFHATGLDHSGNSDIERPDESEKSSVTGNKIAHIEAAVGQKAG